MVSGGLKLFQVVNCLSEKVVASEKVGYRRRRLLGAHSPPVTPCISACISHTFAQRKHAAVKIYIVVKYTCIHVYVYVYKIHMQE